MSLSPSIHSVRHAIAGCLCEGHPSIERTAHILGCSPRTLQRRLHDLGTSYGELVDEVRGQAARHLLEEGRLHLFEIAKALGFADPSSFSRFFRRMYGRAPRSYRKGAGRDPGERVAAR
jgi:AraC-like DNA-binding protein